MSELNEYFSEDSIDAAKKIVRVFHGKLMIDTSIGAPKGLLVCVYMLSNKQKTSAITEEQVKELFMSVGLGDATVFSKARYELEKRNKPPALKETRGNLSLTFVGLNMINELLNGLKVKK